MKDPALAEAGVSVSEPETVGIPGIIHSTFLRFKAPLDDPLLFKQEFERAAATWTPLEVTLTEVCFTLEDVPYMHGASPDKILVRYPLRKSGGMT
eukprot:SAG31_NODE_5962_length_2236_cov_1.543753_3_plen_95_part_00